MIATSLANPLAEPVLPPELSWHCEPARWSFDPLEHALRIEPEPGTDFWRKTHYGFEADNGHFLHANVAGNFTLAAQVRFRPVHQYDQAGLMVRLSPVCWLKTSIEYEVDGPSRLGAVVTSHGYSDWSTQASRPGLARSGCGFTVKETIISSNRHPTAVIGSKSGWPICRKGKVLRPWPAASMPAVPKAAVSSPSSGT